MQVKFLKSGKTGLVLMDLIFPEISFAGIYFCEKKAKN